jgi:hypothetical protein
MAGREIKLAIGPRGRDVRFVSKGDIVEHFVSAGGAIPEENGLGRLGPKIFRDLRGKQLAPAARADVTLDEFARIRWLETDAAVATLVALRCTLIFGVRLADLLPRRRLQDRRSGCRRAKRKRRTGERHSA